MLENALFESGDRAPTRKPATVILSAAIHAVLIVVLILVPLFQPQVVPTLAAAIGISLAETARARPPDDVPAPVQPLVQTRIQVAPGDLVAPSVIPSDIALIVEGPDLAAPAAYGIPRRDLISVFRAMTDGSEAAPPPPLPEPPPAPAPALTAPLRVSSGAQQANLIYRVKPEYPSLARQARVQGVVILEAMIAKDGTIGEIRVVSGHPLLNDAAIRAVQQWRYKPTMLNREPVEVITTVTVTFSLQ